MWRRSYMDDMSTTGLIWSHGVPRKDMQSLGAGKEPCMAVDGSGYARYRYCTSSGFVFRTQDSGLVGLRCSGAHVSLSGWYRRNKDVTHPSPSTR